MTATLHEFEQISLSQNDIDGFNTAMFDALVVHQTDNSDVLMDKLNAVKSFRIFLTQLIQFDKLISREARVRYIKLVDKLNQQIENLEILTGQKSLENLEKTRIQFAKKTQFPLGIILE
jgi:hypothetical protein